MTDDEISPAGASGLWLTISELAEAKDITRASASERVLRLEEQGLLTTRPGKGRTKLVNLAEFDRVVGQVTDLARETGAATRRGGDEDGEGAPVGAGGAYTREQAKRMAYLAEISRLDLEERLGSLVKVAELRPVIEAAGRAVAKAIDTLPQEADALRDAARDEDQTVFQRALQAVARQLRAEVVKAVTEALPAGMRGEGAKGAG